MTDLQNELSRYELAAVSLRSGSPEIFLLNPATGNAANLTRHPGFTHRYPSYSFDGSKIAFTSDRDGAFNLYLMDSDGGSVRQLTYHKDPAVAYLPSWTADGKTIVFGLHQEQGFMCGISSDGQDFRIIGKGHDPNVSPDGKLIAYTDRVNNGYVLLLLDIAANSIRQLTYHENEIGAVSPAFSPNGGKILYSDTVNGALEIFCIDAAGSNCRQLTHFGKMATSPAWSHDVQWISFRLTDEAFWTDAARSKAVYSENKADKRPVWIMRADGSDARVVEPLHYQAGIDGSRAVWRPKLGL